MADSQSNTSVLKSGIYAIRCLVNGKVYVGSAVNIVSRWRVHKHHLTHHKHHSIHLQRVWDKHGPEAFSWEILEYVEPEQFEKT
jgi:group I intron endonuclease